jgi:hypothetical protein
MNSQNNNNKIDNPLLHVITCAILKEMGWVTWKLPEGELIPTDSPYWRAQQFAQAGLDAASSYIAANAVISYGEPSVSLSRALTVLNEALQADPQTISALMNHRVICNEALANHPTIQVGIYEGEYKVGLLGLLNGLFGIQENKTGYIGAITDAQHQVLEFVDNTTRPGTYK